MLLMWLVAVCIYSRRIWNYNSHLHKYFHFINFVTSVYIIRICPRKMYEHRNMQECYKKQMLCVCVYIYI